MYKITHFDKKLCRILHKNFNVIPDNCGIYSIWRFCPLKRWEELKEFIYNCPICQANWFPVIYWIVLIISVFGSIFSLREFLNLYFSRCKRISVWRERKYYVLPYQFLKKCRLVGSIVTLNVWLLLLYAVISVSPSEMAPWLYLNLFVLGSEFVTFIIEVMIGTAKLDLYLIISFLLPLGNYLFVRCVRNVFYTAIENNNVNELCLWKPFF